MTFSVFLSLLGFAFVSAMTPGPNNLMLMASGANYGVRRSVPHALGISIGFPVMILLVALGVGQVFDIFPGLHTGLKVAAVAYMLWLAWKIASATPHMKEADSAGRPLTFLQAAGFQWVNPKAWTMALSASTLFLVPESGWWAVLALPFAFLLTALLSTSTWTVLGVGIRRLLETPARLRAFNIVMALLLVASLWLILR